MATATDSQVSIPYKSGPKFCAQHAEAMLGRILGRVSIPYKSGPKFCAHRRGSPFR